MLPILACLPIVTICGVLLCSTKTMQYRISMLGSIITLWYTISLVMSFDTNTVSYQLVTQAAGIWWGVDALSMWLILLLNLLIPLIILGSWTTVTTHVGTFLSLVLWTQVFTQGVFMVLDILCFYVLFEIVLLPMFLLINMFGSRHRKLHAAYQFFLYTFFGSVFLLLAMIYLIWNIGSTDYLVLISHPLSVEVQLVIWCAMFLSFAIKIPMLPFHIWLPEAHVEAPTSASVLLAALLLKLGSFGFIRYSLPLCPEACRFFTPLVFTLCLLAIIYSSLICLTQWDIKKIIAYSSVAHMNTATIGLFSNDVQGIVSSMYFLLSHGLISSALFFLVGFVYDRYHTRTIKYYRGLTLIMPLYSVFFLFFTLGNIAVPGTSGFIAEFLVLVGLANVHIFSTVIASLSIILAPAYSLYLYHRIAYGSFSPYLSTLYSDLTSREFHVLFLLAFLTLGLGLFPHFLLDSLTPLSLSLLY